MTTSLEDNLAHMVRRLARHLPADHPERIAALHFLERSGYKPSILRGLEIEAARVVSMGYEVQPRIDVKMPAITFYHGPADKAPKAPEGINYAFAAPATKVTVFVEHIKNILPDLLSKHLTPAGFENTIMPFGLSEHVRWLLAAPDYTVSERDHLHDLGWNVVRKHMNLYVLWGQNMVLEGKIVPMYVLGEGLNKALIA